MVKIIHGSVVIQTTLGCKFPTVYTCQKLWKLAGSIQYMYKVIAKITRLTFLAHPVYL